MSPLLRLRKGLLRMLSIAKELENFPARLTRPSWRACECAQGEAGGAGAGGGGAATGLVTASSGRSTGAEADAR